MSSLQETEVVDWPGKVSGGYSAQHPAHSREQKPLEQGWGPKYEILSSSLGKRHPEARTSSGSLGHQSEKGKLNLGTPGMEAHSSSRGVSGEEEPHLTVVNLVSRPEGFSLTGFFRVEGERHSSSLEP